MTPSFIRHFPVINVCGVSVFLVLFLMKQVTKNVSSLKPAGHQRALTNQVKDGGSIRHLKQMSPVICCCIPVFLHVFCYQCLDLLPILLLLWSCLIVWIEYKYAYWFIYSVKVSFLSAYPASVQCIWATHMTAVLL